MKPLVLLLAIAGLCMAARPASANQSAGRTEPGKEYVYKNSGGAEQKLEVYFPANHDPSKDKVPGILLIHGGGWTGGDLTSFRDACQYFAKRGCVAATINYRMLTNEEAKNLPKDVSRKGVCITDGKSALRWFKQHGGELGVDPDKIVIGGGSAGGHIAMLCTVGKGLDDPSDPAGINTDVVAYLLFNPAFSVSGKDQPEVNVFDQLRPGTAPSIFFFGEKDEWKPASDDLRTELSKQGARTVFWVARNQGHGFWQKPQWHNECLLEADRFLVSLGILKGQSPLAEGPARADFTLQQ